MLPSTIDWMFTAVGRSETINKPAAKKAVNTTPITASSRNRVRCRTIAMPSAASSPVAKAPAA